MTFELLEKVPFGELDIEIECDSFSVLVPFAECSRTQRITSVECRLIQKRGRPVEELGELVFHEFAFQIAVTSEWGLPPVMETMDREIAREFLPRDHRHEVMPIVSACAYKLLFQFRPTYLYRATVSRHPPNKALEKHNVVTIAAETAGYEVVSEGFDSIGRRFWLMMPEDTPLTASRWR